MKKSFEYSVVIRTVGTAGGKYLRTLESIDNLNIKPQEVIVVLPEGYNLPTERLGYEQFVFSKKGMLQQRVYGAMQARCEYILFLDDDVCFEASFIEKMSKPILEGKCNATVPPQFDMLPPKHGLKKIIPILSLTSMPTVFNRDKYVKILRSGGWSYNRFNDNAPEYLYTKSPAGIGFLTEKQAFLNIRFEEEKWLEDTKYSWPDDQVMFYKYILYGYKVICVTNAEFTHLDAGSKSENRANDAAYAIGRNRLIFWYKLIYNKQNRLTGRIISKLMYNYSYIMQKLFYIIRNKPSEYKQFKAGHEAGVEYIKGQGF